MNEQAKNNYERIVEIIVFLITELKHNKNIEEIDVDALEKRGYTSTEISTAFSWLIDRVDFTERLFLDDSSEASGSFRILHEAESDLFTQEAWGELVQLHSLGFISNAHIETIIEKAVMVGVRKIDVAHLKSFIAASVFNAFDDDSHGSRFMLDGSDQIN